MPERAKQVETDLQIEQDPQFLDRDWRAQHIGWIVMLIVILLAILGLFGKGLLSTTTQGERGDLQITYDRIARQDAPATIQVVVGRNALSKMLDTTVTLWMTRQSLMEMRELSIIPAPSTTRSGTDSIAYTFPRTPQADSLQIQILYSPNGFGLRRGFIGIVGGTSLPLQMFVLP